MSTYVEEKFPTYDFMLLFLSHLKLHDVNRVDVVELGYTLANLYYVGEYRYVLNDFKLRETINHDEILDIDGILMDAYILGYLKQDDRRILLSTDFVKKNVIPKFDEMTNEVIDKMALSYVNRVSEKELKYDKAFLSNMFFVRKHNFKK